MQWSVALTKLLRELSLLFLENKWEKEGPSTSKWIWAHINAYFINLQK